MLNFEVQCFPGKLPIALIELYLMLGGRAADMNNPFTFLATLNIKSISSPTSNFGKNSSF